MCGAMLFACICVVYPHFRIYNIFVISHLFSPLRAFFSLRFFWIVNGLSSLAPVHNKIFSNKKPFFTIKSAWSWSSLSLSLGRAFPILKHWNLWCVKLWSRFIVILEIEKIYHLFSLPFRCGAHTHKLCQLCSIQCFRSKQWREKES